MQKEARRGCV
jgi:hypothetical protein